MNKHEVMWCFLPYSYPSLLNKGIAGRPTAVSVSVFRTTCDAEGDAVLLGRICPWSWIPNLELTFLLPGAEVDSALSSSKAVLEKHSAPRQHTAQQPLPDGRERCIHEQCKGCCRIKIVYKSLEGWYLAFTFGMRHLAWPFWPQAHADCLEYWHNQIHIE